jgi:GTP cyclohydrolase I
MTQVDYPKLLEIGKELLEALGEDPAREGLQDTPKRFANAWQEFIEYEPGKLETVFESVTINQMVIVSGIRVWSICEHHLLPFWCDVSIGYIGKNKLLGLSKFARIAHAQAHKLQVQERLVEEIASEILRLTDSESVAVLAEGEHLCMTMRGIQTPARMISSVMRGVFQEEDSARAEFLSLIKR